MLTNLVDYHCHLDLYPDYEAAIQECEKQNLHTLSVTTTPKAWPRNWSLTSKTRFIRAALGLHPQLVAERAHELQLWESYLPQTKFVGEVGLDRGPQFYQSFNLQKQVFERILTVCNAAGGKILTIHSVRSVSIVLDMIEKHLQPDRSRVVLHWFTGNKAEAQRALDLGCYFSLNVEMLKNERHLAMVRLLPVNRILTETDGPFIKSNGQPVIRPKYIATAVNVLAQMMEVTSEAIAKNILSNLQNIETFY